MQQTGNVTDAMRYRQLLPWFGLIGALAVVVVSVIAWQRSYWLQARAQEHRPARATVVPVAPVSRDHVSGGELDAYMASAVRDASAEAHMMGFLQGVREELGVDFAEEIECRGRLCKATLFMDLRQVNRLRAIRVRSDVELKFQVELGGRARLIVFATAPGATFGDLLGQRPGG